VEGAAVRVKGLLPLLSLLPQPPQLRVRRLKVKCGEVPQLESAVLLVAIHLANLAPKRKNLALKKPKLAPKRNNLAPKRSSLALAPKLALCCRAWVSVRRTDLVPSLDANPWAQMQVLYLYI